ncbi:MAG: threonine aldolase [Chloroflexi bacterium]|nr:threonine aldolase [Chloroflexota bacterium]MCH2305084.1 aminotransferase class V-fold PLP-dependent enzyme [SAR202 cluster bacterium]|tara:strand:+ start:12530 stop:13576 length:1047 start_codon:yes stop_codon:yes gene_type:complete
MQKIDFRSDTSTHPTKAMREAIYSAKLGDDMLSEDPTVNELEDLAAKLLGKEDALLVSSGTMGNLVSILSHSQRGDEIIIGNKSHIFRGENSGASTLGGISIHVIPNQENGELKPDDIISAIKTPQSINYPSTSMVSIENTQNACGGAVLSTEYSDNIGKLAKDNNIKLHLDGARIFNASVYLGIPVSKLTSSADSITFCLSKGLSCPIGSIICGDKEFISRAKYWRKTLGGAMRQLGIVAASGIVALNSMIDRLKDDHTNAQILAKGLKEIPGIEISPEKLPTNLVFFDLLVPNPQLISDELNKIGIKGGKPDKRWRFVTHSDISSEDIYFALNSLSGIMKKNYKSN